MKRRYYAWILGLVALFILSGGIQASTLPIATLAWDPHDDPDVIGYSLYIKEDAGYTLIDDIDENSLTDPLHPEWTVQGLDAKEIQWFVLTASTAEQESGFSNEACGQLCGDRYIPCDSVCPGPPAKKPASSGGGGCFISTIGG